MGVGVSEPRAVAFRELSDPGSRPEQIDLQRAGRPLREPRKDIVLRKVRNMAEQRNEVCAGFRRSQHVDRFQLQGSIERVDHLLPKLRWRLRGSDGMRHFQKKLCRIVGLSEKDAVDSEHQPTTEPDRHECHGSEREPLVGAALEVGVSTVVSGEERCDQQEQWNARQQADRDARDPVLRAAARSIFRTARTR